MITHFCPMCFGYRGATPISVSYTDQKGKLQHFLICNRPVCFDDLRKLIYPTKTIPKSIQNSYLPHKNKTQIHYDSKPRRGFSYD